MSRFAEYLKTHTERPPKASNQFADRQKADRAAAKFGSEFGDDLFKLVDGQKSVGFYVDWRTALSFGLVPKTPAVGIHVINLEKLCSNPLDPAPEKLKSLLQSGVKVFIGAAEPTADAYLDEWEIATKVAEWLLEDADSDDFLKMG